MRHDILVDRTYFQLLIIGFWPYPCFATTFKALIAFSCLKFWVTLPRRGGGGATHYNCLYRAALPEPREVPLSRLRYVKLVGISLVAVYKRIREICNFRRKDLKELIEEFMAVKKSRIFPGFTFVLHLQQLKGMHRSKLGMWKGYHLSKGRDLFCQKWYIKG